MDLTGNINADGNLSGNIKIEHVLSGEIVISGGGGTPILEDVTVKSGNTQQTVTAGEGYDGIGEVTVEPIVLQNKTVTPSASQQTVTADTGYDGLGTVTVGAASGGNDDLVKFCSEIDKSLTIEALPNKTNFLGFGRNGMLTLSGFETLGIASLYYAQGIDKLYLPDIVTVASQACYNSVISMVDLGPNITTIASGAFNKCSNLKDIYVRSSTVPTIASDSLPATYSVQRIHIKSGMTASYEADANWGAYAGKFVEDLV